jgi:N-acetylglucosamine kinase-like BadF-type ATPase
MPAISRTSLLLLPPVLTEPARRSSQRFVMGVDGGATKTLAAVLDLESCSLHLGHAGPSNEDAIGPAAAVRSLLVAVDEAMGLAGIGDDELAAAVVAVAGTDTPSVAEHLGKSRTEVWTVVNDVVGAWATATSCNHGLAVIAGTGSNAFGVGPQGPWRAGGWGHVLGDEGGAYWLGIQSIKAALRDREGSGPETALSEAVMEFFREPTVESLASHVYSKPLTKTEIAAFAVHSVRIADAGDAVARDIYERGATELGEQVAAVVEMAGLRTESFPAGLIGSVFRSGDVFTGPLTRAIAAAAPGAQIAAVKTPPVAGSLLLAARAAGRSEQIEAQSLARLLEEAVEPAAAGQPAARLGRYG